MRATPDSHSDKQFGVALLAAPFFCCLLWMVSGAGLEPLWPLHEPLQFLLLILVYPLLEELVFRGVVQPALYDQASGRRYYGPISLANLLTSLLFAGLHFIQHPPLWAALVLLPSLLFGYFRDRHGSLRAPLILHVVYNASYFLLFPP